MKVLKRLALLLTVWALFIGSSDELRASPVPNLPHLDPEMTGFEYRSILNEKGMVLRPLDSLGVILETGKRNLEFFDHLNALRAVSDRMELWNETNTIAYPISSPSISNRDLIRSNYDSIVSAMPVDLKKILLGTSALPNTSGLTDAEYLEWSRKLDRAYQSASRWILMEPYLVQYAQRAEDDVRGYVYFRDHSAEITKLPNFTNLPSAEQQPIAKALVRMCMNDGDSRKNCEKELDASSKSKTVPALYTKYLGNSKKLYDEFFELGAVRKDIQWTATTNPIASIPFLEPATQEVRDWLIDNIEDEWKWAGWQLKLDFKPAGTMAYVRFVAGATANVSGLGGNRITMDANRNIQHYTQRWTIRHEFGHVLGFPDCYVEFYDDSDRVMVNYQLDTTNLMCSRRGKLKESHYLEMKKHYMK